MIMDKNLILSGSISAAGVVAGQLITNTGNTLGANVLDTGPDALGGNQAQALGDSDGLLVVVDILQTLTSAGAATVTVQLVQADSADLATNLQVLEATDAFGYAELAQGKQILLKAPRTDPRAAKRYFGVRYIVGTAALTNGTGQFFASIVKDAPSQANRYYKSGFAVQ